MVDVCYAHAEKAGWWKVHLVVGHEGDIRKADPTLIRLWVGTKMALVHSEVSEALEGYRKDKADEHLPHRKAIEVELADALIRICDLAGGLGLDLGGAVSEKLEYNARREDHKLEVRSAAGGKAF